MLNPEKANPQGGSPGGSRENTTANNVVEFIKGYAGMRTYGRALLGNGYLIIPIKPGHKRPALDNWQTSRLGAADLTRYPNHGVGVLCGQGAQPVAAIDVDTTDGALAARFVAWCQEHLGLTCERVGNAPKVLLAYRAEAEGWGKATGAWFEDLGGARHRLEILGKGQQFVAYHIHPDTGAPYEWVDFFGGLEAMRAGDLPVITEAQVEEALQVFEAMAEEAGLVRVSGSKAKAGGMTSAPSDDLDRIAALAAVTAETVTELRSTLDFFSESDASDYDFWVLKFGHAMASLKETEFADDACAIWHGFSAISTALYNWDEAQAKWESINPDESTYRSIFTWAEERGWQNPRKNSTPKTDDQYATREDQTDTGNANLLARLTNGNLRYVPERCLWLWWDGHRWIADQHGALAHAAALGVARHYHNKAAELMQAASDPAHDGDGRKKLEKAVEALRKWERQCRNRRTIDNMLATAAKDARFHVLASELDRDPWLLGVENGVVDLRTGQLRKTARDEFVTKRAPIAFNVDAKAPRWQRFIEEITGAPTAGAAFTARPTLAAYLQRALGYSLTGSTAEQKMFICIGAGSNGKNVLLDMFQWIAGDHCQTIPPEALMATRHDNDAERPSPTAASLAGARTAISSESKDGQKLDVALVKRHTGGGYMTARLMRENTFRFEITHKLWLMTNHRPALDHLDDAMRGRLHMIPFDRRWNRPGHPERDPNLPDGDKDLMAKLKAEAEGVLAWLISGAVAYVRDGITPPAEVVRMTRDYFNDQDALGKWLEDYEICAPKDGQLAGALFDEFSTWCHQEGFADFRPNNQKAFSLELKKRGHEKRKGNDGARYGLRIRADVVF